MRSDNWTVFVWTEPGYAEEETLEDTDTVYNRLLLDRAELKRLYAHFFKGVRKDTYPYCHQAKIEAEN